MTDEEMAEEYAHNHIHYEVAKREDGTDYAKEVSDVTIKQAYLSGLEAGRPNWHKVSDGDLPKIGKPCLVYLVNDCVITARLREDNVWTTNGRNAFENVIAWCEIPQYTEDRNV